MMKPLLLALIFLGILVNAEAGTVNTTLLQEGRKALENGHYEEAINCLGQILEKSGDVSYDSKVLALHRASQAYGMLRLKDHSYDKNIEDDLLGAIAQDPEWEYPKKLLGQLHKPQN